MSFYTQATRHWRQIPLLFRVILLLGILIPTAVSVYLFVHVQRLSSIAAEELQQESRLLLDEIGQHMILPEETPSFATVIDQNRLPADPFFRSAQNGDKVVIYSVAQKAILYRPSLGKIVDITTLSASPAQPPL